MQACWGCDRHTRCVRCPQLAGAGPPPRVAARRGQRTRFFVPTLYRPHDGSGVADAAEGGRSRASVLYIEDSAPNVRLVEHILHAIDNLEIASAPSGEHGIRLARRLRPSIILLDLHLPDLRGEEVLERLPAQQPTRDDPVVVISGDLTDPRRRRSPSWALPPSWPSRIA